MDKIIREQIDPYNEEIWDENIIINKPGYFIEIDNELFPIELNSDIDYHGYINRFNEKRRFILPGCIDINFIGENAYENSKRFISKFDFPVNVFPKKLKELNMFRYDSKGYIIDITAFYGTSIRPIRGNTSFSLYVDYYKNIAI